jgi:hypothetical protein
MLVVRDENFNGIEILEALIRVNLTI